MKDQQLEKGLRRRAAFVPDAGETTARAMFSLGLPEIQVRRNSWTIPVMVAPVLISFLLVFFARKESILTFAVKAAGAVPDTLQVLSVSWFQFIIGLAPGFILALGAMAAAGFLFGSWSVGDSFIRQSKGA